MNQIWQSIRADFKQRTRQQSFMVTLMAMAMLTLFFFPAPDAYYQTLVINGYRGIYNSAWLGMCLAMLNVLFLPLICFYLVKNALELDRQSMTGELIAATPVSKLSFLLGKWCTSVLIMLSIVLVMLLSSVVIQFYYGESYQVNLWALLWPQIIFVFPMILAIAAVAIMFESIRTLKGSGGNIFYFFLWTGSIVHTIESTSGIGALLAQIDAEVADRFPSQQGSTNMGISINNQASEVNTFIWHGVEPTLVHLWGMIPLLFICFSCLVLAFIYFDRFSQNSMPENKRSTWLNFIFITKLGNQIDKFFILLTKHFPFTRLLRLELKLILKGHSVYWFIGLLMINIIQLFISQKLLISLVLPISWLWCVLVVSQLGILEKQSNTLELITYSKQSSTLQSFACYSASWILLALASVGSVVRFIGSAEWMLLAQLFIATSFTVSLAYFCGSFTGNKRMFEVLYPALWYIGPIQATLYIDFFGVNSQASWQVGVPYFFAAISICLLMCTVKKKSR